MLPRRAGAPATGWRRSSSRDLDARRAHGAAPFVSDAEAMPIYVWPPIAWWTGVTALAATAWGLGLVLDRRRARVAAGLQTRL